MKRVAAELALTIKDTMDCLSRALDGLDVDAWQTGDLAYVKKQLWSAAQKVLECHSVVQHRQHQVLEDKDTPWLFERMRPTRPRGA